MPRRCSPPTDAGVYSGISVLSNALYFVSFVLIWIVLSSLTMENPRHNRRLLRTAYSLLGVMAAGAVLGEFLLRGVLSSFLLGSAFGGQGNVLIIASLYQVALVGATLYAYYLLVLRRRRALLLAGCVFLPTVAAPVIFPPSDTDDADHDTAPRAIARLDTLWHDQSHCQGRLGGVESHVRKDA